MKKILLLSVLFAINLSLFAKERSAVAPQNGDGVTQQLADIKKKTDKLGLTLHTRVGLDASLTDPNYMFGDAPFKVYQLRIDAKGCITDNLWYRWRQRLNSVDGIGKFADNASISLDFAGVGYTINDQFAIFAGRQNVALGGIEYDKNPIDVFQFSNFLERTDAFLTGLSIFYHIGEQEFVLQASNAQIYSYATTYPLIAKDIKRSKLPLVYSLNWNGNLFGGALHTRWSTSLTSQAENLNSFSTFLGNLVTVNKKLNFYVDVMYSFDDFDKKGIITEQMTNGAQPVFNVDYLTFVSRVNYKPIPSLNLFCKGIYEVARMRGTEEYATNKFFNTSLGYQFGVEYFPTSESFRFFTTFMSRNNVQFGSDNSIDTNNVLSIGCVYSLPLF